MEFFISPFPLLSHSYNAYEAYVLLHQTFQYCIYIDSLYPDGILKYKSSAYPHFYPPVFQRKMERI